MTDESPVEPKSLGAPTVDHCKAVYGSMLTPTVRTFHAKMVAAGYDISLSGAQRFIARQIAHFADGEQRFHAMVSMDFA